MTKITLKQLQLLVNETQRLREESWNDKRYQLTIGNAANLVCREFSDFERVVYLLCEHCWNDAQYLKND